MKDKDNWAAAAATILLCGCGAIPAGAQTRPVPADAPPVAGAASAAGPEADATRLEDIVVTAQSRSQRLREVPVSAIALSGGDLQTRSVARLLDLQTYTPNFTATETARGTQFFVRGIGSGNNRSFEQSVGLYVDGIQFPLSQQARAPFFDVDRIEVLRGPQSILFGKNAIAGALSIVSATPTAEFEARSSLTYEFEQNDVIAEAAVSGPVASGIRVRVAGRYRRGDGFMRNLTLQRDEPQREEASVRGLVSIDLAPDVQADLKGEYSRFDSKGRNFEIFNEQPAAAGPFRGLTYGQILVNVFRQPASLLNTGLDNQRNSDGETSNNRSYVGQGTLRWTPGEYEVRATGSYTELGTDEFGDLDLVGAKIFESPVQEGYRQYSGELRVTSPKYAGFDFVGGAFYQWSRHRFSDQLSVPADALLIALANAQSPGAGNLIRNTQDERTARVDAETIAAFGQVNVRPVSGLTIQLGGRLSRDRKDGVRSATIRAYGGGDLPAAQAGAAIVYASALGVSSTNLSALGPAGAAQIAMLGRLPVSGSRTETRFSPEAKLLFKPTSDVLLYASFARAYKSGGFDFLAQNKGTFATSEDEFEFDDERSTTYEVGAKLTAAACIMRL